MIKLGDDWFAWEKAWCRGDTVTQLERCLSMVHGSPHAGLLPRFHTVRDLVAACMVCAASEWDIRPSDLFDNEVELINDCRLTEAVQAINARMARWHEPATE